MCGSSHHLSIHPPAQTHKHPLTHTHSRPPPQSHTDTLAPPPERAWRRCHTQIAAINLAVSSFPCFCFLGWFGKVSVSARESSSHSGTASSIQSVCVRECVRGYKIATNGTSLNQLLTSYISLVFYLKTKQKSIQHPLYWPERLLDRYNRSIPYIFLFTLVWFELNRLLPFCLLTRSFPFNLWFTSAIHYLLMLEVHFLNSLVRVFSLCAVVDYTPSWLVCYLFSSKCIPRLLGRPSNSAVGANGRGIIFRFVFIEVHPTPAETPAEFDGWC